MDKPLKLQQFASNHNYSALVATVPYAKWLAIEVQPQQAGRHYVMPYSEKVLGNPYQPALHGGAIAGFMENAALLEVIITEKQNRIPKPIDFSIDYLRPGKAELCNAQVKIVREGRRVVLAAVDCWQQDRELLIAQGRVHLLLDATADLESQLQR